MPDYNYHVERARSEMDRAYQASNALAAAAHMKLSALHMARARIAKASQAQGLRLQQAGGAPDAA
jgi:hypothetical protein